MPPLTVENSSALVPGGGDIPKGKKGEQVSQQLQTRTVRVTRNFYYQSKPVEKGTVITLPKVFATEMIAANKAEPADGEKDAPPPAPPKGAEKKGS